MWCLLTALAADPVLWVDPEIAFPGNARLLTVITNPTTAHAVVLLDDRAVAEVPPRARLTLRLPAASYRRAWRLPEGSTITATPLVVR